MNMTTEMEIEVKHVSDMFQSFRYDNILQKYDKKIIYSNIIDYRIIYYNYTII